MHKPVPEASHDPAAIALREALARADGVLARVNPILEHLLATPDHSLFSEELVARIGGMCRNLAAQVLRAQAEATGEAGREAFAELHSDELAGHLFACPRILSHCHSLGMEWQLATRMEAQYGLDPVLSPGIQDLIASTDEGQASTAMATLAAQARFAQSQKRMELPLAELSADLFHEVLLAWRRFNGERRSDAMIRAEAKLRNTYDESGSRLSLLARLVAGIADGNRELLSIDKTGVALFATALAVRSGQPRPLAILATNEGQAARLALSLRAAGLDAQEANAQLLRINPQADPHPALIAISPEEARTMLSDAGTMGAS